MSIDARLIQLGITLPAAPKPVAAYVPARRVGNLLFISGQLPFKDGQLLAKGPVTNGPGGVTTDGATTAARQCAINALAVARDTLGSLDRVAGVARVGVWVACNAEFVDQPKVANGASELLVEVFGDPGRHARAAVGTNALPLGATVEVEVWFEVKA